MDVYFCKSRVKSMDMGLDRRICQHVLSGKNLSWIIPHGIEHQMPLMTLFEQALQQILYTEARITCLRDSIPQNLDIETLVWCH